MIDSLIHHPIAIVGMACRLPGADGIDALWNLLLQGRDAISELPLDRLDPELYFDPKKGVRGKTYSKLGGMIPLRPLDFELVPMASKRWDEFDECHWILSEVAASAWQHAGMRRQPPLAVGVYVGHSGGSRQPGELIYATQAEQTANILDTMPAFQLLGESQQASIRRDLVHRMRNGKSIRRSGGQPNLDASAAARLIAENLGVLGPQMVIDAACASSLASLGMACLALQSGRISSAIVAGASYNKCDSMVLFSQAQSCSSTGTRPFDENADGLISSEGYIAIVLKTLAKAIQDENKIWGVLRGIGISTDGRGKSLWAPRREGQLLAVKRAYSAEVRPENVQYIEAHATSTQIGDATEIQALADYFAPIAKGRVIPIGSIKSNIGHTLETAGLAGLLKTVLAMHHETIPATANLKSPSRSIPWHELPFVVPTSPERWMAPARGLPRCGAVNAFGIGGLNVHVVVEQFEPSYHGLQPSIRTLPHSKPAETRSRSLDTPIAVVGRGVIVPGACGMDAFEELRKSGRSELSSPPASRWPNQVGIDPSARLPWNVPTGRGGYLLNYAYDWRKHRVPPKQVQHANPLQFMLLDAAGQAIEEANRQGSPLNSDRTSVVVGTIFGGEFGHQLQMGLRLVELRRDLTAALRASGMRVDQIESFLTSFEDRFLEVNPALLDETGSFTSSTLASRITKQYNLMGGALAVDAAECSALAGLLASASLLQNGSSDAVICASGHRAMDLPAFETLFAKGRLSDTPDNCQVPGEGVVVFVLKRLEDAIRDSNHIYGIVDSIETHRYRPSDPTQTQSSTLRAQIGDLQGAQGLVSILECFSGHEANRSHQVVELSSNEQLTYRVQLRNPKAPVETIGLRPGPNGKHKGSEMAISRPMRHSAQVEESNRKRVAVFPGQGSQHSNMLAPWLAGSKLAKQTLAEANQTLLSLGSPPFDQLVANAIQGQDQSSWSTQASMLIADSVHWSAWIELGLGIDAVAGHSLGELAAMLAAGVWDLSTAIRFVHERAKAVDQYGPADSGLLSIHSDEAAIQEVVRHTPRAVFITHLNGPKQVVVGGKQLDLATLQQTLQAKGISASLLNVPAPFHTPMMAAAAEQLVHVVAGIRLQPPRIPFLSSVTNRYEADPEAMRRNLISQLIAPVHYSDLIAKLRASGAKQFIEIGPGQVLTKLNLTNLKGTDAQCIAMGMAANALSFVSAIENHPIGVSRKKERPSCSANESASSSEIHYVDATSSRRQRMREKAEATQLQQPVPPVSIATSPSPKPASPSITDRTSALEIFVRDFIVEQTGYPQDMIQLDWDLEADLGIDSIKLVQLMGELRELFEMDPAIMLGSNIRTLRDILSLLEKSGGKREWLDDSPARETPPPQPASTAVDLSTHGISSEPASNDVDSRKNGNQARQELSILRTFMIDFVIEQTGYPRDMVDVDADLEADLGLDSIKLAQLFGELRSHFDFAFPTEQRTVLSGVRTLRDILKVLGDEPAVAPIVLPSVSPSAQPSAQPSLAFARGKQFSQMIQKRLVQDCESIDPLNTDTREFAPISAWADDSILEELAAGANVHLDNMIGLVSRHSHRSNWAEVFDGLLTEVGKASSVSQSGALELSDKEIAKRYVLRTVPSAHTKVTAHVQWHGPALVLGSNPVADALMAHLKREGVEATCLDVAQPLESLLAELDASWGTHGFPHLFIATAHDVGARLEIGDRVAHAVRNRVILSVFWLSQRWLVRNLRERNLTDVSLVALTCLGGDFGFEAEIVAPESGAIAGLLKAILIESWVNGHRGIPIKIIDASLDDSPQSIVSAAVHELAHSSFDTEISWTAGQRRVVRALPLPARPIGKRPSPGIWICTGGGRGITALVAEELAGRYGLQLHLLGRAPQPKVAPEHRDLSSEQLKKFKNEVMAEARNIGKNSVKAWQDVEKQLEIDANVRLLRAQGIEAYYHCCDVTDEAAVEQCLHQIREQHGPITGCLHGAGVGQDARFDRKRVDKVQECIRAKVDGMVHIMRHTWNDPIEYFIGFGSISGRFGANGHADYSAANEALAKYIGWYRQQRPSVAAVAFHWHAWGDVGMATKPETKLALEMIDIQFMPADEGIRHLIREIEAGAPEREVLITDDRYYRMFYPAEVLSKSDPNPNERSLQTPLLEPTSTQETILDLSKNGHSTPKGDSTEMKATCLLDAKRDIFLREHRLNNEPLLPFVISLELLAEAALRHQATEAVGQASSLSDVSAYLASHSTSELLMHDVQAVKGLKMQSEEQRRVSIVSKAKDQSKSVRILSVFKNRQGIVMDANREYFRADVSLSPCERLLDWPRPSIDELAWVAPSYPSRKQAFYVGPSFQVLRRAALSDRRVFGQILAPSLIELVGSHRKTDGWMVPSAVLDACLFSTGILAWNQVRAGVSLPLSIDQLRIAGLPDAGEPCLVESRLIRTQDRFAWFDFCLWGRDTRIFVEAANYRIAWID